MRIWKMLGWDTKEARTERNANNNQTPIQNNLIWAGVWVVAIIAAVMIWA